MDAVMPKLTARIHQVMAQQGVPGVALGLINNQEVMWSGGFGYADVAAGRAMDADTICGAASITKTFTATAIMQLRDQGGLSLDDPVGRYIPEIRKVRCRFGTLRDLTLRRLMTHRSGLVGEAPTGHWWEMKFPSVAEILALLPKVEMVIEPDSIFKYNNLAFVLLGEVIARVTGRTYRDYIRRRILRPLQMLSSGFELANPRKRDRLYAGALPGGAGGFARSSHQRLPGGCRAPILRDRPGEVGQLPASHRPSRASRRAGARRQVAQRDASNYLRRTGLADRVRADLDGVAYWREYLSSSWRLGAGVSFDGCIQQTPQIGSGR